MLQQIIEKINDEDINVLYFQKKEEKYRDMTRVYENYKRLGIDVDKI